MTSSREAASPPLLVGPWGLSAVARVTTQQWSWPLKGPASTPTPVVWREGDRAEGAYVCPLGLP